MSVASRVVPLKNSTLAIVPSVSLALAARLMVPGAVTIALLAGAVSDTDGATLALTVMLTAAEVVVPPALS